MSRQLEQIVEERQAKRSKAIVECVEFGLEQAIHRAGAELVGLAVKFRPGECLVVVKVVLAGRQQVAFVGADDFGSALLKAVREARRDKLRWREDKYLGTR